MFLHDIFFLFAQGQLTQFFANWWDLNTYLKTLLAESKKIPFEDQVWWEKEFSLKFWSFVLFSSPFFNLIPSFD
jgi:hypothetical protein